MRVFPFHKVMIVQKQRLRQYYIMQLSTSHVGKITKINIGTVAYTFFSDHILIYFLLKYGSSQMQKVFKKKD